MSPKAISVSIPSGAAFALGALFLAAWASGIDSAQRFAATRMSPNTAVCGVLAAIAILATLVPSHHRYAGQLRRASTVAALACTTIAALTGLEHLLSTTLGIDAIFAPHATSSSLPATSRLRMPPSAAVSFVILGLAIEGAKSEQERVAIAAQAAAASLLAFNAFAILGYTYDVSLLYRPTPFIRSSPLGSLMRGALAFAILAMRPEIGIAKRFLGRSTGARSVRALLPTVVILPIVLGGLLIAAARAGVTSTSTGIALLVVSLIVILTAVVTFLGRSLDALDRKRSAIEEDLRRFGDLTGALANAGTVAEVVRATLDGLPLIGASSGTIVVFSNDKQHLEIVAADGLSSDVVERFRRLPITAKLPICEAVRANTPVLLETKEDRARRFPEIASEPTNSQSWAAFPLECGERVIGGIALSFSERNAFEDATVTRLANLASQCGQALDRAMLFDSEREARRTAEDVSRVKDEFFAILGHELRNPLAPILTSLALMKLRGGDQFSRERAVIERQARHLARLVDDLLDVSRVTRGKIELRTQRVEVAEVVASAIEIVSPLLEQRGHHLDVAIPPRPLAVRGDPERLKQVFVNLLSNACKYTEPGGRVAVSVALEDGTVVIRIRDSGVGLPAELLPRVFEMFVQGQRTLERSQGGLGLGLAIVHSLVAAHGGSVEAHSKGLGHGSEFIVRLPVDESPPIEAASVPISSRRGMAIPGATRVLVVDDNTDAAELLAEALSAAGHEVRVAHDGPSALSAAEEFRPTLLFLDIGLPAMDGYEVARRVRSEPWGKSMKIVAVTGYGQAADRERAAAAGFNRHLVKPVELRVTLDVAAEAARHERLRRSGELN